MKMTFHTFLAALLACSTLAGSATAEEAKAGGRLANSFLQDEVDQLPADNTAYFAASRRVKVKLDLLTAMEDQAGELSSALVTVIRPNGQTTELTPDADGNISIEGVEKGAHAIVASGERVHGTMLYYFDQQPAGAATDPLALDSQPSPTKMTLMRIRGNELRSAIDRVRNVSADGDGFIDVGTVGSRFNYTVTLGPNGTLLGRVIIVGNQGVSPGGVTVTIYYKGNPVGSTLSDNRGEFSIAGLRPGVHGLVASGRAGYSAFAFDAVEATDVVQSASNGQTLVSAMNATSDKLPVVLCPPQMVQGVVKAITTYYPDLNSSLPTEGATDGIVGDPIGPVGGGFTPPSFSSTPMGGGYGGGGGYSGGGGGFGGGGGGLIGLAGIGAAAAIAANSNNDNNTVIVPMQPSSPSIPSN